MKFIFNIFITAILIELTMLSCNDNSDKSDSSIVSTPNDTTSFPKTKEVNQESNFDVLKFVKLTDSLLTKIQSRPICITFKIDTIAANKTDKRSLYSSLFPSTNNIIRLISFDPGKGNRELRIWFVEATYQDSITTNKAFEELHRKSGEVDIENDYSPGLTYTNDYVIKSNNKIYWLNSGCSYAFSNHQKLKQFILQSLRHDNIQDSIWCKCGQSKCSL